MRILLLLTAAIGMTAFTPAADARPRDREQDKAWRETKRGRIMPLRVIEAKIMSDMEGHEYIGPELIGNRYRLKFIVTRKGEEPRVMWIDVDARTGREIGRSR